MPCLIIIIILKIKVIEFLYIFKKNFPLIITGPFFLLEEKKDMRKLHI